MRTIWWFAAVFVTVVGCGSVKGSNNSDGGGGDDVAADFTLSLDPTSLSIPIASSKDLTVTVSRTGGIGDISLTAESLPANLIATFTPTTLSAETTTATLTVTAVGGMAPSTGMFVVSATGSGLTKTANVSVSTTTITVSGKVRSQDSGVTVGLVGKPSVTTGAGGLFTFTDVTPPYDLYVVGVNGETAPFNSSYPTVNFYDDLTRADPTVDQPAGFTAFIIGLIQCSNSNGATISGSRMGLGNNTDSLQLVWSKGGKQTTTNGSYSFCGFAGSAAQLYGFQYSKAASGAPTAMFSGVTTATVVANTPQVVNVSLATSAAATSGTFTAPSGFPTPMIDIWQQVAADRSFEVTPYSGTSAVTSILAVPGLSTAFYVSSTTGGATSAYSRSVAGVTTDLTITLPDPATQTAPVAAATGVTTATPLQWTGPDSTLYQVNITASSAGYHVFTTKKQITIPSVNELPLPPGASFNWDVTGYASHTATDEAADTAQISPASSNDFVGPARASTSSGLRAFTTAN